MAKSKMELLSIADVKDMVVGLNAGQLADTPDVIALKKSFIEDEIQVAEWRAHEPLPTRNLKQPVGYYMIGGAEAMNG